jgi:hypothetical protein
MSGLSCMYNDIEGGCQAKQYYQAAELSGSREAGTDWVSLAITKPHAPRWWCIKWRSRWPVSPSAVVIRGGRGERAAAKWSEPHRTLCVTLWCSSCSKQRQAFALTRAGQQGFACDARDARGPGSC